MADVAWLCARTEDADATRRLAQRLAAHLTGGDLMVLTGDLGAGKTCFTQGLGLGLGVEGRITSPTFTLVAEHQGRLPLHHLDVYRLDDPDDALDLDLPELLETGVTVIEWGERIDGILPVERATIELRFDEPAGWQGNGPDLGDAPGPRPGSAPGPGPAPRRGSAPGPGPGPESGSPEDAPVRGPAQEDDSDHGAGDLDNPDRRLLRLELRGQAWVDRAPALAQALQPWAVPC